MGRDLACSGAAREPAGLESREPDEGQRGGGSAKQEVSLGGSDPRLQREIPTWSISAYAQDASSIFFFLNLFIFLWRVIALQSCVHLCCTPIWISYMHINIPSLSGLPPIPPCHHRALNWAPRTTQQRPTSGPFHTWECTYDPLQCSCLQNPRDGEAWWAAVYGVAQSRTRLERLSSSSSRSAHMELPCWLRQYRICLRYRRPGSDPWVGKIPWRREWLLTPVFVPGKFHGQSRGSQRAGHEWVTNTFSAHTSALFSQSLPPSASPPGP